MSTTTGTSAPNPYANLSKILTEKFGAKTKPQPTKREELVCLSRKPSGEVVAGRCKDLFVRR